MAAVSLATCAWQLLSTQAHCGSPHTVERCTACAILSVPVVHVNSGSALI
jgi:hypothetical protein